jgi:predicted ATPase with chaperone activity
LAVVAALLAAHRIIPAAALADALIWGALADDGTLAATVPDVALGTLALASGLRRLIVPASSEPHDAPDPLVVVRVTSVADLVVKLRGELPIGVDPWPAPSLAPQALARVRAALELMIAGQHHALVRVSARESSGLLRWLAAVLPQPDERLAAERLALGQVGADPFARVHVLDPETPIERVLGKHRASPGPACLAHGGVLVLDRVHRYAPRLLEHVRGIVRGEHEGPRPSDFTVLATVRPRAPRMQPLACPHSLRLVTLVAQEARASGEQSPDPPEQIRARITLARARQLARFGGSWPALAWTCNAKIPATPFCLDAFCATSKSGRAMLVELTKVHALGWSSDFRANLLRVARTVADLDPDRDPSAPLDRECIATAAMFMPAS